MPEQRRAPLTRADLPDEFTPETVRELPLATLRQLADQRSELLSPDERRAFEKAMRLVMRETAQRVSRQLSGPDWSTVRREGARAPRSSTRTDQQLERIARRIGRQVDLAEELAPGVDWSFAQPSRATPDPTPEPPTTTTTTTDTETDETTGTVSDLEDRINEQVELVEVMSEIAEISKRTFALEQQRDLQNTRTVFFGFVVSVAVLVSGWAPLVATHSWSERLWIICLTLGTCVLAAAVYGLVRRWQGNHATDAEEKAAD